MPASPVQASPYSDCVAASGEAGAAACQGIGLEGDPANSPEDLGKCTREGNLGSVSTENVKRKDCNPPATFAKYSQYTPSPEAVAAAGQKSGSTLADQLDTCGVILWGSLVGCLQWLVYIVFVTVPSFLMKMSAKVFDFMAQLTLSPDIYSKEFIEKIWRVVRDFANIFFILILLYAAFQIMLDLGHGGGKKIIAAVIVQFLFPTIMPRQTPNLF